MSTDQSPAALACRIPHPGISFGLFVCMMAGFMALNGLAIDSMLPALPMISEEYALVGDNQQQWIISAYLLGFGVFQLFFGPVADRYGRRGPLLFGVAVYTLFSVAAVFASSFEGMLVIRVLQGAGAAATRTLTVAIVRDNYSGRKMARVMSLIFIVFLMAPVLAPTIGQGIMLFSSWHWIFGALALFSTTLLVWAFLRLPESLRPEDALPLSPNRILQAFKVVVTTRISIGYTIAMTLLLGCLFGFINSAQQIFADVFDIPRLFTLIFALIAGCMAVASLLNARIVEKLGTRLVSHTAILGFLGFSLINLALAYTENLSLLTFTALMSATMFCFGLTGPNFGSMAMEPVGHIAGTAASVQGCITTLGGAIIGLVIGQNFNGTAVPLLAGYTLLSAGVVVVLLMTEGRLFQAHHSQ